MEGAKATEDLFTPIHKALRSMIYDLGGRLQNNDFQDVAATSSLIRDLENDFSVARLAGCVLCTLHQHADDEEFAIFPPASASNRDLIASLIQEHQELTRKELAIMGSSHDLLALDRADDRVAAGIALNQMTNELFAAYMVHMNREEAELVPRMKEQFTDEQMARMRGAIIGRMPPERVMATLHWMAPALNPSELTNFLGSMRRGAPPEFFRSVTDLCATRIDPARWNQVRARLGL
jgi:hypothetical protein